MVRAAECLLAHVALMSLLGATSIFVLGQISLAVEELVAGIALKMPVTDALFAKDRRRLSPNFAI